MVTASHNPKQDDGYKVYWENAAQIIPPHDSGIALSIDANLAPWQAYDTTAIRNHELLRDVTDEVADAYLHAIEGMSTRKASNSASTLKIAYTGKRHSIR